jgi:hypothetical protein
MAEVNEQVSGFLYDSPALEALENSLSVDRLLPYLNLAEGDKLYAIRLYEWNTKVSESLYSLIQGLEVTLRNKIHQVLSLDFGQQNWWDCCDLKGDQISTVHEAIERILDDEREPDPSRVVAELMLGFWISLFGTDYAQTLYDRHLWKCFPAQGVGRKTVAKNLKTIRFLRNRVAHHESVIGKLGFERNLRHDVQNILQVLGWMCPITARWVSANSSFDVQYDARPQKPPITELFPEPPGAVP